MSDGDRSMTVGVRLDDEHETNPGPHPSSNDGQVAGDRIEIDIPNRTIGVALGDEELQRRREAMVAKGEQAWKPAEKRRRFVSQALQAYSSMTTSAAYGAVRDVTQIQKRR